MEELRLRLEAAKDRLGRIQIQCEPEEFRMVFADFQKANDEYRKALSDQGQSQTAK